MSIRILLIKRTRRAEAGFTLVELLFVILIVGIISIMVAPGWQVAPGLGLEFEARRVLDDIRFTQAMSITSGQRYRWVQLSSSSYAVYNEAGTPLVLPAGSTAAVLTSSVTFSGLSNLPNNLIAFDSLGTPYITSGYPGTVLSSTASITLSNGSTSRTIQITPQTGFGVLS